MPSIAAVLVLPPTPLLLPGLAGSAESELTELRSAIDAALLRILSVELDQPWPLVALADAEAAQADRVPGRWSGPLSTAEFGADLAVPEWPGEAPGHPASDSLTSDSPVSDSTAPTSVLAIRAALAPSAARASEAVRWSHWRWWGNRLDPGADGGPDSPVLLVVAADGGAGYGSHGPLAPDPRAPGYDAALRRALSSGDPHSFADLDAEVGRELLAASSVWSLLPSLLAGRDWSAQVHYFDHPYGITYPVASWIPQR